MKIIRLDPDGIKAPEKEGVRRLEEVLPDDWLGYANLWMCLPNERREIDVVLVTRDCVIIVDLKHWQGSVSNNNNVWYQNGKYRERSAALKIEENARYLGDLLGREGRLPARPWVHGRVVFTARPVELSGLNDIDRAVCLTLDEFVRIARPEGYREILRPQTSRNYGDGTPLCGHKHEFNGLFCGRGKRFFRPQEAIFRGYRAISGRPIFGHPRGVYAEYRCEKEGDHHYTALLRYWDFDKLGDRFSLASERRPIAQRESRVLGFVRSLLPDADRDGLYLRPLDAEEGTSIRYWELYDLPPRLERLEAFVNAHADELTVDDRIDLIRVLLARVADLHRIGVAHRDLSGHSIWLQLPARVTLSSFMTARFPDVETLEGLRLDLLAGRHALPEDRNEAVHGSEFAKDVFLLGEAAWIIATGQPLETLEGLPVWERPQIGKGIGRSFDAWFERAIEWDPERRFPDAQAMLDAFNAADRERQGATPSGAALVERYRLQTYSTIDYPVADIIKRGRALVYTSGSDDAWVLVKLWPTAVLGDLRKSATALSAFFDVASELKMQPPEGVVPPISFGLAVDGLLLVQRFVDAPNLTASDIQSWEKVGALGFMLRLLDAVATLHEREIAHGDLKPENILVSTEGGEPCPLLVDIPNYWPDGAPAYGNTSYGPAPDRAFDKLAGDRHAACKILAELLGRLAPGMLDSVDEARLHQAMTDCGSQSPPFLTLAPIRTALERAIEMARQPAPAQISAGVPGISEPTTFLPDNGLYHVSARPAASSRGPQVFIAGSDEQLVLTLDVRTRRVDCLMVRQINSYQANRAASGAVYSFKGRIELVPTRAPEADELRWLLNLPEVVAVLAADAEETLPSEVALSDHELADAADHPIAGRDEESEDPVAPLPGADVAAPATEQLWTALIEAERNIRPEFVVAGTIEEDRQRGLLLVPYEASAAALDFDPYERVFVDLIGRSRGGAKLGELDHLATTERVLAVRRVAGNARVRPGDRLCLQGHADRASFDRRRRAVDRIVARHAPIPDLIEYFDPRFEKPARALAPAPDDDALEAYGLDESQKEAFQGLWTTGPLGLLQGPPGTGKTTFISALVHYAITKGGAHNVLLASQSHEAVNNAMERIAELARETGDQVDMLRVGQESFVSPPLRRHHTDAVQQAYREQFRASRKDRMVTLGRRLGLPETYVAELHEARARLTPLVRALQHRTEAGQAADADAQPPPSHEQGLRQALRRELERHGCDSRLEPALAYEAVRQQLAKAYGLRNLDALARLDGLMALADEWENALASRHRNLEEFLARSRTLVCGTCVGIGRTALRIETTSFDLVVIDEAARCNPGELAVAMQVGRRVILVGDHRQLPPFVDDPIKAAVRDEHGEVFARELERSDFERAFTSSYGRANSRTR